MGILVGLSAVAFGVGSVVCFRMARHATGLCLALASIGAVMFVAASAVVPPI